MAVYPIRPKEQRGVGERCPLCERKYTNKRKPAPAIFGYATNKPVFDWECQHCADAEDRLPADHPLAVIVEDTVNWRGD